MFELSLQGVKKYMDATLVLESVSFQVFQGEKIGIVGENGSGKSTILKLIAGILPMNYYHGYPQTSSYGYDEGFVRVPDKATCAYLEQIPEYPLGVKVIDVLNSAFEELHKIENEMRVLESEMSKLQGEELDRVVKKYGVLVEEYETKGGYEIKEKIGRICTGLKFKDEFLNRDFSLLSGGEKTTVVLGKLLIDNPDILLLDEPTNHLDMESIEWLESYLRGYKGIVVVVSHDRYFLDNVVTKIVEVIDKRSISYKGNYSEFAKQKEENMIEQIHRFKEQQKEMKSMEKNIKELRDWANRVDNNKFYRRAQSLQKRLDKMKNSSTVEDKSYRGRGQYVRTDKPITERNSMKLNIKQTGRSGNETIMAEELFKSFEDKEIFKNAEMLINYGDRAALIGANGSGKTTFLKMLLSEEEADSGVVKMGANVRTAYLPQYITFEDDEMTVLQCFRDDISILEGKAREYLSKFMFYGASVFKKIKHLSGGEKIRLKLAKLLFHDVNLLILDEPTNHLDIDSIETLEEALEEFKGTIFFISHDRYFINKMAQRVVSIEDYKFRNYDGNYDYYKELKDKENKELELCAEPVEKVKKLKKIKKKNIDEDKEREKKMEKVEAKVNRLENEISEIELLMEDSSLPYSELAKLFSDKEELSKELDKLMEEWIVYQS